MVSKFKSFLLGDKGFFSVLLVLIGIIAYGLGLEAGQLNSASGPGNGAAIIFTEAQQVNVASDAIPVVVSRGGTKYHRLDCPGADSIKKSNKVYFQSIELARSAGYLPASNCEGLK